MSTTELEERNELSLEAPLALSADGDGRLMATIRGACIAVRLRQCFPWTEPRRLISLRDTDDREVAFIGEPDDLDEQSRLALDQSLAEAGFVFHVTQVLAIDEEVEIRVWTVETNQGARRFQTHLDDWPRTLPGGGLLIRDVAGDLYRLDDPARMDRRSRELLWAFVD